ncbi:DNA repair protein RAD51 homolog 4-like [Oscarella lobularis]|uniref:DNA repair protein RAD51 homolog 4-like n=1 Tax=Oscarella lobularis TaxID=121494 RepID=UPI003313B823
MAFSVGFLRDDVFPIVGTELLRRFLVSTSVLPTGCLALDRLLDGGLLAGDVVELVGSTATGKTQLCLLLCAVACSRDSQCALYIDCNANFSGVRLRQLVPEVDEAKVNDVLRRVRCIEAHGIFRVIEILEEVGTKMIQIPSDSFYDNLKLIIIDSVAAVTSPILGGQQIQGHKLMMDMARLFKILATEFNLIVMCTNNVVYGNDGEVRPSLGKTWSHVPSTRLLLEMTSSRRTASITKSSRVKAPSEKVEFFICEKGFSCREEN